MMLCFSVVLSMTKISDLVKMSPNAGVAVSISNPAVNYLKQLYIPYLYSKIADFKLPNMSFDEFVAVNLTNIEVKVPEPENGLINNWVPTMHTSTNSLSI